MPVVAIDDAMVRDAVAVGNRIGLLATANSTVKSSASALEAAAKAAGKDLDLQIICNEATIAALKAGDQATHDRLVMEMADQLQSCDTIVLAQASMAHMEEPVAAHTGFPTFSSPGRCVEQVREILESLA